MRALGIAAAILVLAACAAAWLAYLELAAVLGA